MNDNYVGGMKKYGLERRLSFQGLDYPMSSLYFQLLTHRGAFQNERWQSSYGLVSGPLKKQRSVVQNLSESSISNFKSNPSSLCKLCPHAGYCENSLYHVDINERGFDDNDATID